MRAFVNVLILFLIFGFFISCSNKKDKEKSDEIRNNEKELLTHVPDWAQQAIWYQILVERYRNGDSLNDPTKHDIIGANPEQIPENWAVTSWGHDWYKPDAWFNEIEDSTFGFHEKVQLRRYGGDFQGVLDKLDYIADLGVTAIYFNPINDAPSYHKYDARNWRHADRNFGSNPQKDEELINSENPSDPTTWQWTNADRLFLKIIKEVHARNMRLIVDYSWNHTGKEFWALKNVQQNGANSEYKDWYEIKQFDNPETSENEFDYVGWYGLSYLPEIREDASFHHGMEPYEGDLYDNSVKQHIFNVAQRWLDPNNDGNPEDGIDGFRLDVAAELPMGFWRDFRKHVRRINPEAYLIGEIWWKKWPDQLMDPRPYLQGDVFDAIMNYRWYKVARNFFAEAPQPIVVSEFVSLQNRLLENLKMSSLMAMMNLTSSHDSPRTLTSLYNDSVPYKFHTKPSKDNISYKIEKPDEATYAIHKLLLVHQFTYIGSPHIWSGDEFGMWGADDPDTRKPIIWDDINFENETHDPLNRERTEDIVEQNHEILNFYKLLIKLRNDNPALKHGSLEFTSIDDNHNTLSYNRKLDDSEIVVAFNLSDKMKIMRVPVGYKGYFINVLRYNQEITSDEGLIKFEIPAKTAYIWVSK